MDRGLDVGLIVGLAGGLDDGLADVPVHAHLHVCEACDSLRRLSASACFR